MDNLCGILPFIFEEILQALKPQKAMEMPRSNGVESIIWVKSLSCGFAYLGTDNHPEN